MFRSFSARPPAEPDGLRGVNDEEIARWDEVIKSVGNYMSFFESMLLT